MSEESKAKHLSREKLLEIIQRVDAEHVEMSKFDRVGPKKGPHLMVSRAAKTSLIYGYGFNLAAPAVTNYSVEDRKEKKLGGITLQLDLSDEAAAYRDFEELVKYVHAEASKTEA